MREEFWVFGYGSLMWRPGFAYEERQAARISGLHRQLCIYSHVHRGTPENPGLVMGLDRGGRCRGIAYRVNVRDRVETLSYLRQREQVTMVYIETIRIVEVLGDRPRRVPALTYMVDRRHRQYAGRLNLTAQRDLVLKGVGQSGACVDYVRSTLQHLREMGVRDHGLEALVEALGPAPA